ncbi:MAG: serine/threonine protein kinase, partial [Verrucomicrobia bacterium]|nr:serine/threonine protein kinase [Verrucomicrobiota bacterium]
MSTEGVTRVYLLKPGATIGTYKVVRPLGAGGMGEVYLVEHTHLRKSYALKILPADICSEPQFVDRFRIEARVMADLEHPHIVRVHNFGEDGGKYYLVMDYVEGPDGAPRTLEDELAWGKKLPETMVREIALQLCDALVYAHGFQGTGIIHRDLKPSNILVQRGGDKTAPLTIKVADFGLAKIVGGEYIKSVLDRTASLTIMAPTAPLPSADQATECGDSTPASSTISLLGTYDYMSPEQKAGGPIDARSDLYAVGIILYRLLTGHKPDGAYEPPSKSGADKAWDAIVRRCLQRKPEKRYATAAAMLADLATAGLPVYRKPRVRMAAVAASALLVLGAVWFIRPGATIRPDPALGTREQPADTGFTVKFRVKVQPSDARVTVRRGQEIVAESDRPGFWGTDFRIRPGVYTFAAAKSGYRTQQQDIAVGPKETEWTVRLDEVYGQICIARADGAKVSILSPAGRELEIAPTAGEGGQKNYRVQAGSYEVIVTRPNHAALSQRVEVAEDRPVRIDAVLTGLPGRLRVRGEASLEIWQFGKLVGLSGDWIPGFPSGDHTLELRRSGFRSVRLPVTVPPNGEADLAAPVLVERHATLIVR